MFYTNYYTGDSYNLPYGAINVIDYEDGSVSYQDGDDMVVLYADGTSDSYTSHYAPQGVMDATQMSGSALVLSPSYTAGDETSGGSWSFMGDLFKTTAGAVGSMIGSSLQVKTQEKMQSLQSKINQSLGVNPVSTKAPAPQSNGGTVLLVVLGGLMLIGGVAMIRGSRK